MTYTDVLRFSMPTMKTAKNSGAIGGPSINTVLSGLGVGAPGGGAGRRPSNHNQNQHGGGGFESQIEHSASQAVGGGILGSMVGLGIGSRRPYLPAYLQQFPGISRLLTCVLRLAASSAQSLVTTTMTMLNLKDAEATVRRVEVVEAVSLLVSEVVEVVEVVLVSLSTDSTFP